MHRTIRHATYDDIPAIMPVIDAAREMMHASGFSFIGYTHIDLGIAKYHFELAAGKENFNWKQV